MEPACNERAASSVDRQAGGGTALLRSSRSGSRHTCGRSALDDVFKEIAVMKLVDHPNILRLHEVLDDDETGNIYIVLDLMEHGSCEPQEHGLEFFPEERARRYFNDTLLGLEELHNQGIMHHDIKPENLLLSAEDRVKIGDLGIAQVAVPAEWDGDGITHTSDELRRAEAAPRLPAAHQPRQLLVRATRVSLEQLQLIAQLHVFRR